MKNYMNIDDLRSMFCSVAEEMEKKEHFLTELDRKVGDGDHGRNMAKAFSEIQFELPRMQFTCAEEVFQTVGTILMDFCAGASGVLFGTMFLSGTVRRQKHFIVTLDDFSEIFRVSLDALIARGKATPGDKTMIDALEPAVKAFEKAAENGCSLQQGFNAAAKAAEEGLERTVNMAARTGRAKYYPQKGMGCKDPGAASVWLIFQAMSDWADRHNWTDEQADACVTTLTLNPCIDKTIDVSSLNYGGVNKILAAHTDVSGKGINVSTVLRNFGVSTRCLGFNYSEGADVVERFLDGMQIPYRFVRVPGQLRINVKIFEQDRKRTTEYNNTGLSVPKEAVIRLLDLISSHMGKTEILTLCGSVPEGVPINIYRNIIENANVSGYKTILDASGEALREGIRGIPFMIKPNIQELKSAFREELESGKTLDDVIEYLLSLGIRYICVTVGKRGAYLITKERALYAEPVDVTIRGVQGAGDSMLAGMCKAILEDLSDEDILRLGMASAGGSLMRCGTLLCLKEDMEKLLPLVKIRQVDKIE